MALLGRSRLLARRAPLPAALALAAALAASGRSVPRAAEPPPDPGLEYQVKAAFLYNFAKFVAWPPEAFPDPDSILVIGVLGRDPFGAILDRAVQGKTVNGRTLVVRRFPSLADLAPCHILFVSASERGRLKETLEAVRGGSVLTVGEVDDFTRRGGIVNLGVVEGRVHFEINIDAAARAGLTVSSKLLSLSTIVRDRA